MTQCHRMANQKRGYLKLTKSQGHLWWLTSSLGKNWYLKPASLRATAFHPPCSLPGFYGSIRSPPTLIEDEFKGTGTAVPMAGRALGAPTRCCKAARTISRSIFELHSIWFAFVSGSPRAALSLRCKTQWGTSREGHLTGRGGKRSQTPTTNILFLHMHDCMTILFTIARTKENIT